MSRFNGNTSGQQLWNAPITQARTQQQTQQQIQHENEQAWRRSQELQQGEQQPQDYDQYSEREPVDYDIYNKAVAGTYKVARQHADALQANKPSRIGSTVADYRHLVESVRNCSQQPAPRRRPW